MTRLEFTSRFEALSRRDSRNTLAVLGVSVAGMIVSKWVEHRYGGNSPLEFIGGVVLLACAVWWLWAGLRLTRKFELLCPNCSESLAGRDHHYHALITGNCKRCGKPVFSAGSEARPPSSGKRKLTKQEFCSSLEAVTNKTKRRQSGLLVFGGIVLVGFIPVAWILYSLVDSGRFDEAGRTWLMWIMGILYCATALSFLSMFIPGLLKRPGVPCPDCGRPLLGPSGQVAITTGICVYCGGKAFEESS
jgi:hypothetical protein